MWRVDVYTCVYLAPGRSYVQATCQTQTNRSRHVCFPGPHFSVAPPSPPTHPLSTRHDTHANNAQVVCSPSQSLHSQVVPSLAVQLASSTSQKSRAHTQVVLRWGLLVLKWLIKKLGLRSGRFACCVYAVSGLLSGCVCVVTCRVVLCDMLCCAMLCYVLHSSHHSHEEWHSCW